MHIHTNKNEGRSLKVEISSCYAFAYRKVNKRYNVYKKSKKKKKNNYKQKFLSVEFSDTIYSMMLSHCHLNALLCYVVFRINFPKFPFYKIFIGCCLFGGKKHLLLLKQ